VRFRYATNCCAWPRLVSSVLQCDDEISRIKLAISIPVSGLPRGVKGQLILIFASRENADDVGAVEYAV
jgi:hypothetical protein